MEELLDAALEALRRGKVVACATENSFGLLARVDDPAAIDALVRVKPRTSLKGTGLLLPDAEAWQDVAQVEPVALRLSAAFWPGPLSIVQPALPSLDVRLCLEGTVSVRWGASSPAAMLAAALGKCVTATSANPTGQPPICESRGIHEVFSADVRRGDLFVVSGIAPGGPPSTLVTFRDGAPHVLRQGAIASEAVMGALTSKRGA